MKSEEYISSGLAEIYVLGIASASEASDFNIALSKHPALNTEVENIENSFISFSERLAPPLNVHVKEKLFSVLGSTNSAQQLKSSNGRAKANRFILFYQLGMAAGLLLFVCSLVYIFFLNQKLQHLNSEIVNLAASKSYLAQEVKIQQVSLNTLDRQIKFITNPLVKSIALNGLKNLQGKQAVVYWNTKTNEVFLNSAGLPQVPDKKQYQLWAIVDGKPVDMGVINLNNNTGDLQNMKAIKEAQAFAVTIEKSGGSLSPTLETMCFMGNI